MDLILFIELIGVVAFSMSGVLVGIEYELDIFGIFVVAVITSVGGGLVRDILLNNTPSVIFTKPWYVLTSLLTVIISLPILKIMDTKLHEKSIHYLKASISVVDAIGLGLFTVAGVKTAFLCGYQDNFFLSTTVGVITGIGGGIGRDLLSGRKPVVMRKEIYALASILGAILYYNLYLYTTPNIALYVSAPVITIIRLIAVRERLNVPFKIKNSKLKEDN